MNAILVGGCADGERIVLPDGMLILEKVKYEKVDLRKPDFEIRPLKGEVHRYCKFNIHPVTRATIFAYEPLSPTEIMERLLEFYHPPKEVR